MLGYGCDHSGAPYLTLNAYIHFSWVLALQAEGPTRKGLER